MTVQEMTTVLENMGKNARRAAGALAVLPPEAKKICLKNRKLY